MHATLPMLPIEAMLPIDPMLSTLPRLPADTALATLPLLAKLAIDPADAKLAIEPALANEAMLPAEYREAIEPSSRPSESGSVTGPASRSGAALTIATTVPQSAEVCGVDLPVAQRLVDARIAAGAPFLRVDDAFSYSDVPFGLWERIRDRAVVVP